MVADSDPEFAARLDAIYRDSGRRAFATLVRLLGDFDRAEEALHDAFRSALESWPVHGVPDNPAAWLVAAGRFRAIDQLRRQRRLTTLPPTHGADVGDGDDPLGCVPSPARPVLEPDELGDDRLRLVFTCCHPSLAEEARVPLTLREVCGLTTEQIARAFLLPAPTLAQRIVRAKQKIRVANIPFVMPEPAELPQRLPSVLRVVYLVFNEGYRASSGAHLLQLDLAAEAIRLARLLHARLSEPEVSGLLALLLLQNARTEARTDAHGDLVPLDEQDRSRWDRAAIAEGQALVETALRSGRAGSYAVQAAIAAVHAEATVAAATDWAQIAALYDVLLRLEPQPVVALNRAVAIAMRGDLDMGRHLVEELVAHGGLGDYHLAHAALADLHRRAGRVAAARDAYAAAMARTDSAPERRFLARRLRELPAL